jgi:hypothetical protein
MKVFMCQLLLCLILGIDLYDNIILKWLSTDLFTAQRTSVGSI